MEESVLLGTKPLVDSIRHFIRDRLRVWFRHLVLLGCSCPAPSQTRSQAPEYAKWPKMAYSARIMPQSYILLLRPYYARNSAGRMCKGLLLIGKLV